MFGRIPPVVKNIIIINIILYVATLIIGDYMYEKLALFYFKSPYFEPYQLLTHMFMHGSFLHILFNMYTLFMFGCVLENVWGGKKFLFYYLVTGLGAAALHLGVLHLQAVGYASHAAAGDIRAQIALNSLMVTPTVGASGAIYGLLLAYGMLFPNNMMGLVFPPVTLKAKYFVLIFGALELLLGITGPSSGIAHFAHLGGMIFGFFLILYWKKNNRMYY